MEREREQEQADGVHLGTGTLIVVVVDAAGCIAQGSVTLASPSAVALASQVPDTACIQRTGTADRTGIRWTGRPTYQIRWVGVGYGSPVTYSFPLRRTVQVTVTDGAGCQGPTPTFRSPC
ncbi:MAG: hypothetical protein IPN38_17295 [Flavobacteriales bacterium]|nr:hypothetical protein [Flavobacteriales bacterium]